MLDCAPGPLTVTLLEKAFLPLLIEIERHSHRLPWSEQLFAQEFENRFSSVYGATIGGVLVGFLVAHVVLDEAHIVNIAVAPQWRRRGIGRKLLTEVLGQLSLKGARWAYLEAREGNTPALTLYQSLGFYRVATRPRYYSDNGESAVLMNLDLHQFAELRLGGKKKAAG